MLKYGGLVHNSICAPLPQHERRQLADALVPVPHIPPGYHAEHGGGIFRHALGG